MRLNDIRMKPKLVGLLLYTGLVQLSVDTLDASDHVNQKMQSLVPTIRKTAELPG